MATLADYLSDYLSDYRLTLRMKCEGLDAEQLACRSVPPSLRNRPRPITRWLSIRIRASV